MTDRGIRHQPLVVVMADSGKRPEHHGRDRDEDDDLLPLRRDRRERSDRDTAEQGDSRDFRRRREERGDRRRRAFIDVRRPHMERHGRDFECEAREQKHDAEDQADRGRLRRSRDARERNRSGESVNQRRAIKQHARRKRAENEVLQARLGRAHVLAVNRSDHVERERHQFDAEIKRDEIAGRDHHHHAGDGKQYDDRKLEAVELVIAPERRGHDKCRSRADYDQHLEEAREGIDHDAAAEEAGGRCRLQQNSNQCRRKHDERTKFHKRRRVIALEYAEHQQRHRADDDNEFGQYRHERRKRHGGYCTPSSAALAGISAALVCATRFPTAAALMSSTGAG